MENFVDFNIFRSKVLRNSNFFFENTTFIHLSSLFHQDSLSLCPIYCQKKLSQIIWHILDIYFHSFSHCVLHFVYFLSICPDLFPICFAAIYFAVVIFLPLLYLITSPHPCSPLVKQNKICIVVLMPRFVYEFAYLIRRRRRDDDKMLAIFVIIILGSYPNVIDARTRFFLLSLERASSRLRRAWWLSFVLCSVFRLFSLFCLLLLALILTWRNFVDSNKMW